MSDDTNPNLAEVKKTYQLIDDNFYALYAKCTSDDQKTNLIALRDAARDAFWKAVAANLTDNHGVVTQTYSDLQAANDQIQKDIDGLKDVSDCLETLTEAVKLAGALVTLAAA